MSSKRLQRDSRVTLLERLVKQEAALVSPLTGHLLELHLPLHPRQAKEMVRLAQDLEAMIPDW